MSRKVQLSASGLNMGLTRLGDAPIRTGSDPDFWFKTKDVATISPTFSTVTCDWDAGDGQLYTNVSTISNIYSSPSTEHLVQCRKLDPSTATQIVLNAEGIQEIASMRAFTGLTGVLRIQDNVNKGIVYLPNAPNCTQLQAQNCPGTTSFDGSEFLVGISNFFYGYSCNIIGNFKPPIAPNMTILRMNDNPLLTSCETILGCTSLTSLRFEGCGLDLNSVDNLITEAAINGAATVVDVSGGTNTAPSASVVSTQIPIIVSNGGSVTHN